MITKDETLKTIYAANVGTILSVMYTNMSNPDERLFLCNINPLKLQWCGDIMRRTLMNPRLDFSASVAYAVSMWRNGFLIDFPLQLNVHTVRPGPADFSSDNLNKVYGYDGATRMLAIRMCCVVNGIITRKLSTTSLPYGIIHTIKDSRDFDGIESMCRDMVSWVYSDSEYRARYDILTRLAEVAPPASLMEVPARVSIDKNPAEVHSLILSVNNIAPFTDVELIHHIRRLLSNGFGYGWLMEQLSAYAKAQQLMAVASAPDTLLRATLEAYENGAPDPYVRACGFLFTVKATLSESVARAHSTNIVRLSEVGDTERMDAYVSERSEIGPHGKLRLVMAASVVPKIIDAAVKPAEVLKIPTHVYRIAASFEGPSRGSTKKGKRMELTIAQRASLLAGYVSSKLSTIERNTSTIYATQEDADAFNADLLLSGAQKQRRCITTKMLQSAACRSGNDLFLDRTSKDANGAKAEEMLNLVTTLSAVYFTSTRKVGGAHAALDPLGGTVLSFTIPPMKWRKKVEAEYNTFSISGISLNTDGLI